jgi:predicted nucleic acid-binding protein
MIGKYLLDTCFIIGLHNHNPQAIEMIQSKKILLQECAYSVITRLELLSYPKLNPIDRSNLQRILDSMACLDLSEIVQANTVVIRQAKQVKLPDAIILATAKAYNLELLTLDQKLNQLSATATTKI